ncbi:MAG: glucokinase, partial [Candidatus Woesearchaeota archaeon]
ELVKDFLSHFGKAVDVAVFGVPGPVVDGRCRTTNLPWKVDSQALAKIVRAEVALLNDFELAGWGLDLVKKGSLIPLTSYVPEERGTKVLIGAGTGLGEAIVYWDCEEGYFVLPSEGGHTDFAPKNEVEFKLANFIAKSEGFVEWESVLSGPGLSRIYKFFSGKKLPPEKITAAYKHDSAARKAVQLFLSFYAREAANLALTAKATGGVYLVGTMINSLVDVLNKKDFIRAFVGKRKVSALLSKIPIFIVTDQELGLKGAVSFAKKLEH